MHFWGVVVLIQAFFPQQISASDNRQTLSLDNGWRFHKGDIPFPVINGHGMTYMSCKAGRALGAAAYDYDDTDWRLLNLPHDWVVEGAIDPKENISQGYRARGYGWYRRSFKLDRSDKGKHIELQFDGIATHSTIWVNGILVHRNFCGYTSSYIDITAIAKYGEELNNIAVRVDANEIEGWWYEGAGIYRHTWLIKRAPVHIITDGVYANPVKTAPGKWRIPVEVTLENSDSEPARVDVEVGLFDKAGNLIVKESTSAIVNTLVQNVAKLSLQVENPQLWSVDNPILYQVKTLVKKSGSIIDNLTTNCGFRTIRFTPDSGFYLNDNRLKIKGVCNHQDHAGVGVALPNSIVDFRLKVLKEMGANAYRCSHNPPSKELLDACDRMGILVMDENRNFNNSPEYIRQLEWMVRRDRNHPSIIMWSVFNEEPMQGTESGYEMVRRMSNIVKLFDTTRPVTAAMNGGFFSLKNVSHAVDVVGFNYHTKEYDLLHKVRPELCLTSSEDISCVMQRGQYVTDLKNNLIDAYDTQHPAWGTTHRNGWKMINERPYLAGGFVWTGFDYRGEPTPLQWPTVDSNFGIVDLCGFPKTAYYIRQALWFDNKPVLYIAPHWNWPTDSIGKNIKVMAVTNADRVKLLLNGKLICDKQVDKYDMLNELVPYYPGKLEAIGYKNGKEVSRFKVETTGTPVRLELVPDRNAIVNDGCDAVPVTVRALDAKGRPVPTVNLPVEFEVKGVGEIIGLGNGNPNSHEMEKGNKRDLFNGLAQVILQSQANKAGEIMLTAKAVGLKPAHLVVRVKDTVQTLSVPVVFPVLTLDKWRVSPFSAIRPDPNQKLAANDMNSWDPTKPGELQAFTGGNYAVYRSNFEIFPGFQKQGAKIIFKNLTGKAEIWLNQQKIATKTGLGAADFEVVIPPGMKSCELNVLIEAEAGIRAGLGGIVTVVAK